MKRQLREWKNIFANMFANLIKDLCLEYINNSDKSTIKIIQLKWANNLKKNFSEMAHISSKIQGGPPKAESTGSETYIRSSLHDYTLTGDSVLTSMI